MCKFFSLVSDGKDKIMYFDWELRKKCLSGKLNYEPDSHTSIADYFGYKGGKEDKLNKYEYNPITKEFEIDQLNTVDDSDKVMQFCKDLNFKKIVPNLIIKPILNPLEIVRVGQITKQEIKLLKKWDSVWDSVKDSVKDSVWDSLRDSVGDSLWASLRASVWDSVRDSVKDSVWDRDSVGDSLWASLWASVWASLWASVTRHIKGVKEWKHVPKKFGKEPYKCLIQLYEKGLVPSFDGKIWRLHTGKKAKIVFTITRDTLKGVK